MCIMAGVMGEGDGVSSILQGVTENGLCRTWGRSSSSSSPFILAREVLQNGNKARMVCFYNVGVCWLFQ